MKEVDNFESIKNFCASNNSISSRIDFVDYFLFGQIMIRKKDGGKYAGSSNRIIKDFTIDSISDFDKKKGVIVDLCRLFTARAYINLGIKRYRDIAISMAGMCVNLLKQRDVTGCKGAFSSACGKLNSRCAKWIIDVDEPNSGQAMPISYFINSLRGGNVLHRINTVNGYHLIAEPFDLLEFKKKYPNIDVHKNNPTLLFANVKNHEK